MSPCIFSIFAFSRPRSAPSIHLATADDFEDVTAEAAGGATVHDAMGKLGKGASAKPGAVQPCQVETYVESLTHRLVLVARNSVSPWWSPTSRCDKFSCRIERKRCG